MQLHEMRYVVTIAEQKNFSKAAKLLYVSQPALSQAVKRLEERLGVTLFVRELNNVYPTEAGAYVVKHAKTILDMTTYLTEGLEQFRDVNCLHIGISNNYNKYYLPKIIPVFKSVRPDIKVDITEEKSQILEQMTYEGKLDLCMLPSPFMYPELHHDVIKKEEILLALPSTHPFNTSHMPGASVNLEEFKDENWIFLNKTHRFTTIALHLCDVVGFKPNIIFETTSMDTVVNMIRMGEGVGFVADAVSFINTLDSIRFYHIAEEDVYREHSVVYKESSQKFKEIQDFVHACRIVFQETTE